MGPNGSNIPNAPETPKKAPVKKAKKLTRDQRWWRHNILQAAVFSLMGVVLALVLIGLVSLVTLPLRGDGREEAAAATELPEEPTAAVSPSPAPSPSPTVAPTSLSLVAVGDNLIHDTIIDYGLQADGSYDFTEIYKYVEPEIQSADIACIQQETVYISDPSQYSNYPAFGTPAEMADSLAAVGFNVVCHASNHVLDKGQDGVDDTLAAWEKHPEVTVLGLHGSQEDADQISIVEKDGLRVALLDYTYGLGGYVPQADYTVDVMDESHKERIAAQMAAAKSASDFVVVFMHGGTEDSFEVDQDQETWAQFFADQGAGLIIGTHTHTVQPIRSLTGAEGNQTVVFYSLGNFVSSQKDNFNMLGAMAHVTITKDSSGTYVSDYSAEPLVTWIQSGGSNGLGYIFHVVPLADYTEEMAASHIRENCTPEAFQTLWTTALGTA